MQMIEQSGIVNHQVVGPYLWTLEDEWRRYQVEVHRREEEAWNMALISVSQSAIISAC